MSLSVHVAFGNEACLFYFLRTNYFYLFIFFFSKHEWRGWLFIRASRFIERIPPRHSGEISLSLLFMTFIVYFSVKQVDSFLQKVSTEVEQKTASQAANVVIVTDGQLPLRQCLLPETCSKGIADPPAIFGHFYDLRKEFRKGFPNAPEINSIQDMMNCKLQFFSFLFFFYSNL